MKQVYEFHPNVLAALKIKYIPLYENGSEVDFFTFFKQSIFGVVKGVIV